MTPEQFIYENGEKEAREVVEGAPDWATHFDLTHKDHYQVEDGEECCLEDLDTVDLSDLKRLVESLDIIEKFGYDIDGAKQLLDFCKSSKTIKKSGIEITVDRLKQAIEDHKAIYDKAGV